MILVNPDTVTAQKKSNSLDREMSEILNSDLSDDEKAKRYSATLSAYRMYSVPKPKYVDPEAEILRDVTSQHKRRAAELLKLLKPHLSWTSDGEIVVNNSVVPFSNISHLLNKLVDGPVGAPPAEWTEMANVLNDANVPRELIPAAHVQQ